MSFGIVRPFVRNGRVQYENSDSRLGLVSRYRVADQQLYVSEDYDLFVHDEFNRGREDIAPLGYSIGLYGNLPEFHIVVAREPMPDGRLKIIEGHGRYLECIKAKQPIYFMFQSKPYNIDVVNNAQKDWVKKQFINKHVAKKCGDYMEAEAFATDCGVSISRAMSLLSGFKVDETAAKLGEYKIKAGKRVRQCASRAASLFTRIVALAPTFNRDSFLKACYAVSMLDHVDTDEIARKAEGKRWRDGKLVSNTAMCDYLILLEKVYNSGRSDKVAIALDAQMAFNNRK